MTGAPLRVLCAYDGSAPARAAIRAAGALLGPAALTVLTVRDGPALSDAAVLGRLPLPDADVARSLAARDEELLSAARRTAEEGAAIARDAGLDADVTVLRAARPWRAIDAVAAGHDLIVCGVRGHGALSRAVLGSTSSSLLSRTTRPILVVPAGGDSASGPIVAAYDGTRGAGDALRFAARALRSRPLIAACAWRSPVRHSLEVRALGTLPFEEVESFLDDYEAIFAATAGERAQAGAELAASIGFEAQARAVESGAAPWRPLLALAEDEGAALVVCGASGAGSLASGLAGSVAAGLVHHATVPVLVVPQSAGAPNEPEAGVTGTAAAPH